jgi:CRP-like cAMP-binding protein
VLVGRCLALQDRIEAFAYDKTPKRITRALVEMAGRMGRRLEDGALRIPPLTHQFLSDYVGTSREIVTFQMNQLRRQGLIRYSRKAIDIHLEALKEQLRDTA